MHGRAGGEKGFCMGRFDPAALGDIPKTPLGRLEWLGGALAVAAQHAVNDPAYPALLHTIPDPPTVLYLAGAPAVMARWPVPAHPGR